MITPGTTPTDKPNKSSIQAPEATSSLQAIQPDEAKDSGDVHGQVRLSDLSNQECDATHSDDKGGRNLTISSTPCCEEDLEANLESEDHTTIPPPSTYIQTGIRGDGSDDSPGSPRDEDRLNRQNEPTAPSNLELSTFSEDVTEPEPVEEPALIGHRYDLEKEPTLITDSEAPPGAESADGDGVEVTGIVIPSSNIPFDETGQPELPSIESVPGHGDAFLSSGEYASGDFVARFDDAFKKDLPADDVDEAWLAGCAPEDDLQVVAEVGDTASGPSQRHKERDLDEDDDDFGDFECSDETAKNVLDRTEHSRATFSMVNWQTTRFSNGYC